MFAYISLHVVFYWYVNDSIASLQVIQLYETLVVRHGVMLVGPTCGGKTTIYQTLAKTLTHLSKSEANNPNYKPVTM